MTHKLASAALCTTRAAHAAAPTAQLACAPSWPEDDAAAEELLVAPDVDVMHESGADPEAADFADEEPPFDAPDADDEIFQARRAPLELEANAALEGAEATRAVAPSAPAPNAPAIAIHVSWDRPGASALVAAFASDPRLARVEISEARGGLDEACARFHKEPSPDLLVLETTLTPEALIPKLDRLLTRLDPSTRIIVIGEVNDVSLVRDLARRGVVQYFLTPKPADVVRFICELYATRDSARVIAVVGARGGVGASTMAHNLAWSIAQRQQMRTAIVDLDLSFGAAAFGPEQESAQSIGVGFLAPDIVDDAFLERAAITHGARLSIFAAPISAARPFDLEADAVKRVIAQIRRTAAYVVLDVPHHWDGWVKQVLLSADEVLVVASPDLASLRNAKNLIEVLKEGRGQRSEALLALSMVGAAKGTEISAKDFADAVAVRPVEALAFDPALFGLSAIKCKAIGEMAPRSKAAVAIDGLAWVLTGRAPPTRARKLVAHTAPREGEAVLALEKIARPDAFAPAATPPLPSPPPARRLASAPQHHRTYASAQPGQAHRRGQRGALRISAALLAGAVASLSAVHVDLASCGALLVQVVLAR